MTATTDYRMTHLSPGKSEGSWNTTLSRKTHQVARVSWAALEVPPHIQWFDYAEPKVIRMFLDAEGPFDAGEFLAKHTAEHGFIDPINGLVRRFIFR